MSTRTATASGQVRNIGNIQATFRVILRAFHIRNGVAVNTASQNQSVTLNPGETSSTVNLSVSLPNIQGGDTVQAEVVLDITAPEFRPNIAMAGPVSFTEPVALSGELVGFSPSVSAFFFDAGLFPDGLDEDGPEYVTEPEDDPLLAGVEG